MPGHARARGHTDRPKDTGTPPGSSQSGVGPPIGAPPLHGGQAQHIKEIIEPGLNAGKTVICDRYFDATIAYQGYARQLDTTLLHTLHRLLFAGLTPNITLLLDLPPEIGLARAWRQIHNGQREDTEARFEKEALHFHERVRAGYLALAHREPARFRIIDAAKDAQQVTQQIIHTLSSILA